MRKSKGNGPRSFQAYFLLIFLMTHDSSFSMGFDKEMGDLQYMPPNACFSIGLDKQIGDNQCMAPNTSFSIGFYKEIGYV